MHSFLRFLGRRGERITLHGEPASILKFRIDSLRGRTHDIAASRDQLLGHVSRRERRKSLALKRAMALIGTNMAANGCMLHTPGAESFAEDIRYIHGHVPEYKIITDVAYRVQAEAAGNTVDAVK